MRQDALRQDNPPDALDAVDRIVEQWRRERPDLDPSAKQITGRIVRLSGLFQHAYGEAFEGLGISDSDWAILVVLRRAGAPFTLTPTELARQRMMTSGGMTAAIDRMERRGFVTRTPNPADRRGSLVRLTDEGRQIVDAAMERHTAVEHRLVAALDRDERAAMVTLLRKLLRSVEPDVTGAEVTGPA